MSGLEPASVYKFGGGERRTSLGAIDLPCNVVGKNIKIKTEVVQADIPMLVGNTSLEKAKFNLYFETKEVNFGC